MRLLTYDSLSKSTITNIMNQIENLNQGSLISNIKFCQRKENVRPHKTSMN